MTLNHSSHHRASHPVSSPWKRWLSIRAYGAFTSTLFGATSPPLAMRARFERFGAVPRAVMQEKHRGLRFEDHTLGALAVESVCTVEAPSRVIIHLHGGGFFMGSAASYRNRAMRLSYRCQAEVFVPDYRRAPEHPYPAALQDALVTTQYVRALRPGIPVFLTGDSAGGGLALSLMLRLRALAEPMPTGAILLSPWTDLTNSGTSLDTNAGRDLWLSRAHLEQWARYYLGSADPADPLISPVLADLSGLPPLFVLAGEHEVLLDDALRVIENAERAGTPVRRLVGKGMQHDWPLTLPWLEESRSAWDAMVAFVEELAAPGAGPRATRGSDRRSQPHRHEAAVDLRAVGARLDPPA
jgi:epsilon-lactone hydrolase